MATLLASHDGGDGDGLGGLGGKAEFAKKFPTNEELFLAECRKERKKKQIFKKAHSSQPQKSAWAHQGGGYLRNSAFEK